MSGCEMGFFGPETRLKLDAFADFDFASVPSWSVMELWCAANSVEIDLDFLLVMVVASRAFENLYSVLLDAIRTSGFIDRHANTVEFADAFYRMYSPEVFGGLSEWQKFREWYVDTHENINGYYFGYGYVDTGVDVDRAKYEMFRLLDAKFPSLVLKFYAKHEQVLHQKDRRFVGWLMSTMPAKIRKYPQYPVYRDFFAEMLKAKDDADRTGMFLK